MHETTYVAKREAMCAANVSWIGQRPRAFPGSPRRAPQRILDPDTHFSSHAENGKKSKYAASPSNLSPRLLECPNAFSATHAGHVDTNAVILTSDYVDELVEAGMTDIGPDVKGLTTTTFMRITNIRDASLASKLLETEWKAVRYLVDRYFGRIFIGVGIPYNPSLISLDEIHKIGLKLANIEPSLQVCALDYRPEFRRQDIKKPSFSEMVQVKRVLEDAGLRCVICQTEKGHIGPRKIG